MDSWLNLFQLWFLDLVAYTVWQTCLLALIHTLLSNCWGFANELSFCLRERQIWFSNSNKSLKHLQKCDFILDPRTWWCFHSASIANICQLLFKAVYDQQFWCFVVLPTPFGSDIYAQHCETDQSIFFFSRLCVCVYLRVLCEQ